jgi:hypothetical protein
LEPSATPRAIRQAGGYKLHLDVADGDIPISAVLTSASLHDSQAGRRQQNFCAVDFCIWQRVLPQSRPSPASQWRKPTHRGPHASSSPPRPAARQTLQRA